MPAKRRGLLKQAASDERGIAIGLFGALLLLPTGLFLLFALDQAREVNLRAEGILAAADAAAAAAEFYQSRSLSELNEETALRAACRSMANHVPYKIDTAGFSSTGDVGIVVKGLFGSREVYATSFFGKGSGSRVFGEDAVSRVFRSEEISRIPGCLGRVSA